MTLDILSKQEIETDHLFKSAFIDLNLLFIFNKHDFKYIRQNNT